MGTFQSGINNILGATALAATTIKDTVDKKNMQEAAAKEKEQKEISEAEKKLSDARQMAIGYSEGEIRKKEASAALGIEDNKLPKSIKQKTYDRRFANAKAMEAIHTRYAQNKEFRERIKNLSPKDIAAAIKPDINKSIKKKEVANNGK